MALREAESSEAEDNCGTMFTKLWRCSASSVGAIEIYVHCIERISNSPSPIIGLEWRGLWQIYNIVCARDPVR